MMIFRTMLLGGLVMTSACALLNKSDPITPRYFTMEAPASPVTAPLSGAPVTDAGLEVRFGRVSASAAIRERLAYRDTDSTYEVGYYDERFWTDKPEAYVRRAFARELFERRGVRQILSGAGTTVEVDVVACEEIRQPVHVGRVVLSYIVYDDRAVRLSRSVVIDRPVTRAKGDAEAGAVALALAEAMSTAVDTVADSTVAELRSEAAASGSTRFSTRFSTQ
jgi:cholesterol transport system auxiliary component